METKLRQAVALISLVRRTVASDEASLYTEETVSVLDAVQQLVTDAEEYRAELSCHQIHWRAHD
jgi:hypothetical protein